jgi:hypothetical protein
MKEGKMAHLRWFFIPALVLGLAGCSTTRIDWEMATSINTSQAYQDFLKKHPDSEFSEQAQAKLEPLVYQKTVDENTAKGFSSYLVKCAQGAHVNDVRERLKNVRCQDPDITKEFPSWLKKGQLSAPERRASWLLDKSFIGVSPSNIGRGFKATGDDPLYPLELGWGAGHLIYYEGRGVIVGPDGTKVLVGYDCK